MHHYLKWIKKRITHYFMGKGGLSSDAFPLNRSITDQESCSRLHQGERLPYRPQDLVDDMTLIKLNSTYMEVADYRYQDKGLLSLATLAYLFLMLGVYGFFSFVLLSGSPIIWPLYALVNIGCISVILLIIALDIIVGEFFRLTHYPIRFNRRKKQVHFFRPNGKVDTYPWKDIYFTIMQSPIFSKTQTWTLCGHILDKKTGDVIDTFTLSMQACCEEPVKQHWEWIRRYMEEKNSVQTTADRAGWFLPIDKQREPFGLGLRILVFQLRIVGILFFPFFLLQACARWLALRTCKIPVWPEEVEEQCVIKETDRFNFDSSDIDMQWHWRYLLFWKVKKVRGVTGKEWDVRDEPIIGATFVNRI